MSTGLAPAIVVLNRKYLPRNSQSAAQVGASSFFSAVLTVLREADILCGIVLYCRDESLREAYCEMEEPLDGDIPVATVSFNFGMTQASIARALRDSYWRLSLAPCALVPASTALLPPIIYYQTDTLLHHHPRGFQFCVTHHGPFVVDFARAFSRPLAELAFGGDPGKMAVLEQQQGLGMERLLRDQLGTVLAHSVLQRRFLQEHAGIDPSRFALLRPPIGVPQCGGGKTLLPPTMQRFVAEADLLLFTAVARLDYFKNVELLVQTGLDLLRRGLPVRILIVGDAEADETRRRALLETVPAAQRANFLVAARLQKDQLYALFAAARAAAGVFVCPSRYETLGITPLEAAASGVATLITESDTVEAAAYLPRKCRVPARCDKMAARVQWLYLDGVTKWAAVVQDRVRPETSLDVFRQDLLKAWAHMSGAATRMLAP